LRSPPQSESLVQARARFETAPLLEELDELDDDELDDDVLLVELVDEPVPPPAPRVVSLLLLHPANAPSPRLAAASTTKYPRAFIGVLLCK
jgi:hypothetical protein